MHISSRGRPYRVGNDPFLKQVREVAFPAVFDSGYSVAGHIYTLTSEVKKKLQPVSYLDMLPDDLLDAIYLNPAAAGNKQVNPHTGTTVIIGTDHMIVDVALSEQSNLPKPPALLFPEVQGKQAGSAPIQIVKYGGYVVQAGMGSAFSGEEKLLNKMLASGVSKQDALAFIDKLPFVVQASIKRFFKGSSNLYNAYIVYKTPNGNYLALMQKPGNVPDSKAIYYKEIDSNGITIRTYKETYDPSGNLIHTKEK